MCSNKWLRGILTGSFWLLLWQGIGMITPDLLFATPVLAVKAAIRLLGEQSFWLSVYYSLLHISLGFFLAFLMGFALAMVCYFSSIIRMLISPAVAIMKSVPIACFIVAVLIWLPSKHLAILTSFFVAFPITFASVQEGLEGLNKKLEEMAAVYRIPFHKKVRRIWLPQIRNSLLSGCSVSVGMCWKAGIAGEVIGLPAYSIGEQIYLSKIYYAVDDLFAWTLVIILISLLLEKAVQRLIHRLTT